MSLSSQYILLRELNKSLNIFLMLI
jgi:hypothetical protein